MTDIGKMTTPKKNPLVGMATKQVMPLHYIPRYSYLWYINGKKKQDLKVCLCCVYD